MLPDRRPLYLARVPSLAMEPPAWVPIFESAVKDQTMRRPPGPPKHHERSPTEGGLSSWRRRLANEGQHRRARAVVDQGCAQKLVIGRVDGKKEGYLGGMRSKDPVALAHLGFQPRQRGFDVCHSLYVGKVLVDQNGGADLSDQCQLISEEVLLGTATLLGDTHTSSPLSGSKKTRESYVARAAIASK